MDVTKVSILWWESECPSFRSSPTVKQRTLIDRIRWRVLRVDSLSQKGSLINPEGGTLPINMPEINWMLECAAVMTDVLRAIWLADALWILVICLKTGFMN